MQDAKPFVSVVIPTFNRSAILSRCLDSLCNQTYPKDRYEIVIINDGSKDNTEDVLREFEKKAPCGFIWATQKNQGVTIAENSGISRAKGEIICFTGDDCIADQSWIEQLVHGFINDSVGAVGGRVVSYEIKTPIQKFVEDCGCLEQERFVQSNTLITGSAAYRRKILMEIRGFDNYLNACEDLDISIKTQLSGYTLNFNPEALVYHDHPATIKGFYFQQYRNGIGFVRLHRKYGRKFNLGYNVIIFSFRIAKTSVRYPSTLVYALVLKKNKYFVLKPLFEIVRNSGFTLGIIQETLHGKDYEGDRILTPFNFYKFMEDKPVSALWQKITKKKNKT